MLLDEFCLTKPTQVCITYGEMSVVLPVKIIRLVHRYGPNLYNKRRRITEAICQVKGLHEPLIATYDGEPDDRGQFVVKLRSSWRKDDREQKTAFLMNNGLFPSPVV